jgi:restriction system protein
MNARACLCYPKFGSEMVLRLAKKGLNAGKKFWVCSKFPECQDVASAGG